MQDLPLDVQLAGDINAAISEDNEVLDGFSATAFRL